MRRLTGSLLAVALLFAILPLGCTSGVKEEKIEVKQADGLQQARTLLKRYADGQPMTSEATSFPYLVNEVRKTDPAKADVLEKGLEDLKKNPANLRAKAKELLGKL